MKFLPLLLLVGCVTPLNNLYEQRSVCLIDGCPDELHVEIDRREASALKRKEIKAAWKRETWCPFDAVFWCEDDWCQQSKHRQMPKPRGLFSGCVRRDAFIY